MNASDIQMAKELGMTPKNLIKNIPASHQQWKIPVKGWIRHLYEEKFGRVLTTKPSFSENTKIKAKEQEKPIISERWIDEKDLPF